MPSQRPIPPADPRELLSRFRATYRTFAARPGPTDELPEGALKTPAQAPLDEETLPAGARRLLEAYRGEHPDERPVLLKHLRLVDGVPELVVDDEEPLPPDDELLTVSETVTYVTQDRAHVVTDLFVARRR